ncbi:cinnamoyl-CoA reductase-like SNL6 [Corylus avellana]|uniref:cinnamoyl-CoA reductase-like SNL6 n=1 Tax=Corylus avellana TaxID=13451 RepID=UPI001E22595F|nr:cinnamoyl-CoA reductase-like SNL6 [Corylus avellana]
MGILGAEETMGMELEELHRMLAARAGPESRKDGDEFKDVRVSSEATMDADDVEKLVVCVTSGVSYLGLAIVKELLVRRYSVRIIAENQEDIDRLREMETSGEMRSTDDNISVVMAKLSEIESLSEAFQGCLGVFHTCAFIDPSGVSGYTKYMAEIEMKVSENVMKACARTPSVTKCVLTSSLLACIWRDNTQYDLSSVVNHDSWSDESLCTNKKLWYSLGKLRAEKVAWRVAEESGLKLATICAALTTGPEFYRRNPTPTIAYLKGAQEMYANGLLATVDVNRLAGAHVRVFEAMDKNARRRYLCFDNFVGRDEAEKLARELEMPINRICGDVSGDIPARFQLSNEKLSGLMSTTFRSCYGER